MTKPGEETVGRRVRDIEIKGGVKKVNRESLLFHETKHLGDIKGY